jgi:thiosulfate reductase cytochrome b subunit
MYHVGGAGGSSGEFRPGFAITGQTAGGAQEIIPYSHPVHNRRAMVTISQMTETHCPRHPALVRVTHWLTTLSFLALLVTGVEILISHPRFYWGETGNVNTRPLFTIPIPSSRATVPTGYGYVLPDQNGWSRYLHFEAAWVAVLTGLLYAAFGFLRGHFRRNLLPTTSDLSAKRLAINIARHLRFRRPSEEEAWSYNVLQRLTYLLVIFVLFPLVIWTGLAMSPAIGAVFPAAVTVLGGRQSARTLHFFVSILLVVFLLVHVLMVYLAGFRKRVGAMITGRLAKPKEQA